MSTTTTWGSTLSWNSDTASQFNATAQDAAVSIASDAGTPVDGQKATFRILDNGTARAIVWTSTVSKSFRQVGVTLPTTTVINKTTYVGCIYNAAASRWDAVAVVTES